MVLDQALHHVYAEFVFSRLRLLQHHTMTAAAPLLGLGIRVQGFRVEGSVIFSQRLGNLTALETSKLEVRGVIFV